MKNGMLMLGAMICAFASWSQCPAGQVEVIVQMQTDAWPYENYWQLVPSGNPCGTGVLFEGANLNVGCEAIAADAGPESYPAESMVTEGPFCLDPGAYDIIFTDSYGDGGLLFEVLVDGVSWASFWGTEFGNTFTFNTTQSSLAIGDSPCGAFELIPNQEGLSLNNASATASIGEISPNGNSCGTPGSWCESGPEHSLWVELIFESNTAYVVSTCDALNAVDTQLALWKTVNCADWSSFELVSSNDDMPGGCGVGEYYASEMKVSCLDTNYRYFIQIDGWEGATGNIFINAIASDAAPTLDALVQPVWCPVNKGEIPTGYIQPFIQDIGIDANYSWSNNVGFASNDWLIDSLAVGVYTLNVESECFSGSATFEITEPSWWNTIPTITQPSCSNTEDGAISLDISGGTAPYDVLWTDANGAPIPGVDLINQSAGIFTANITDERGCLFVQDFQLMASGELSFQLGAINDLCINDVFDLEAPNYDGAIYQWSDGTTTPILQIVAEEWGVGDHTISVTIVSADGCVGFDEMTFTINNCIGLEERNAAMGIYPNPNRGEFQFYTANDEQWVLIDAFGRQLKTFQFSKFQWVELNISDLYSEGLYFLKSSSNEYKFIKQ